MRQFVSADNQRGRATMGEPALHMVAFPIMLRSSIWTCSKCVFRGWRWRADSKQKSGHHFLDRTIGQQSAKPCISASTPMHGVICTQRCCRWQCAKCIKKRRENELPGSRKLATRGQEERTFSCDKQNDQQFCGETVGRARLVVEPGRRK